MRKLLLPFSLLYGFGAWLHNKLFDLQIKKSVEFDIPVISVGNLSTGGTGKTPQVEYLVKLLSQKFHCGIMSRGYKRRTSGYFVVEENSLAIDTGDEPLQMKRKFPDTTVAVCEERAIGIPIMLLDDPKLEVIILDDAFQHRRVKAGLSVLLTDYSSPFSRDHLLPVGNLREPKQNASRADVIVVTKCPEKILSEEKTVLEKGLKQREGQKIFFSSLKYGEAYGMFSPEKKIDLRKIPAAILVRGIVSASHLEKYLLKFIPDLQHKKFPDHHTFRLSELKSIHEQSRKKNLVWLTTEKDAVRLFPFKDFFQQNEVEIYCVPVEVRFAGGEEERFEAIVFDFLNEKLKKEHTDDTDTTDVHR